MCVFSTIAIGRTSLSIKYSEGFSATPEGTSMSDAAPKVTPEAVPAQMKVIHFL